VTYSQGFYVSRQEASLRSARLVLPYVFELATPKTVIDFGCGTGTWLAAAKAAGAERVLGIEGAWISNASPLLAADELKVADLNVPIAAPERFDLAISLEVAEHLGAERAPGFVADIARASDVVLFGAAIPGQGGTGHVNERWQSYWIELFRAQGYRCLDVVRPRFWNEADVLPWYKQNAFLFTSEAAYARVKARLPANTPDSAGPTDLVHPDLYARLFRDPPLRVGASITWQLARKLARTALKGSKGRAED
jgi:SAM-dependent methyltransferase